MNTSVPSLPSFLIIGAQRAGTTSLYEYLVEHPAILPARRKEVHFFDKNFGHGPEWYASFFPAPAEHGRSLTGEATPYYLFHPHAARRARGLLPQVKLIAVLRNPVDRAESHYFHQVRAGIETAASFEEALALEPERLRGERDRMLSDETYESFNYQHFSYVARGCYAEQLEGWFAIFPREQFLILRSEDLYADPAVVLARVFAFLDLPAGTPSKPYAKHNLAFDGVSKTEAHYAKMPAALRERLLTFFQPHNDQLARLLGMNFQWDA